MWEDKPTATHKERQNAIAFVYQIACDHRNRGRYGYTQIRDETTQEVFTYEDMLRVLRVIHGEAAKAHKEEVLRNGN